MTDDLPVPIQNAESGPYWQAAKDGQLVMKCCNDCTAFRFIPQYFCPVCGSEEMTWKPVSGAGTVASFTRVHRAPIKAFRAKTPYMIALIDLAEGPRMMANIVGADADQIAIGDAVEVCFEPRGDIAVPQFQKAER